MFAILLLSDLFLLLLFARVFTRTDDRASFFNPYLLWARRVTDPVGAFVADLFPGLPVRAACAIAFALYFFRQKRIVSEKNHALIRMINNTLPTPSAEAPAATSSSESAALFKHIDQTIRSEQLYRNVNLQR